MSLPLRVSASILCCDFTRLGDEIKKCEQAGVDALHVDVMDGHFVPNISIGQCIVQAIRPITKLPIETHLMIENPGTYIDEFIDLGSNIVSIQVECYGQRRENCRHYGQYPKEIDRLDTDAIVKDLRRIRAKGAKAFVVINPGTPVCIKEISHEIDGVLMMSVNPGFSKQKFMPIALDKIKEVRTFFNGDIAIDGGVNGETAPLTVKAGANVLATASYFFGAPDPKGAVQFLKGLKA